MKMFLTNLENFVIGSTFSIGPESTFSKGPRFAKVRFIKCYSMGNTRGVFRTESKTYEETLFK